MNSRDTQDTPMNRTPSTTSAATLAPTTVEVRSCHAGSTSFESLPAVTGSDSSRAGSVPGGSTQRRDDRVGEEVDVIEVGHVEKL